MMVPGEKGCSVIDEVPSNPLTFTNVRWMGIVNNVPGCRRKPTVPQV